MVGGKEEGPDKEATECPGEHDESLWHNDKEQGRGTQRKNCL